MTVKEIHQFLETVQLQQQPELTRLIDRLKGKPFWLDKEQHKQKYKENNGSCCFNHIIGLPQKNGIRKPMLDYELDIFKDLKTNKYIWIKKATGLGITEFFLRYITWRSLYNEDWKSRQVPIVVGPNLDLAVKLIKRIKKLFEPYNIWFEDKMTSLNLNGVEIQAYPSNNISSFRSLESPAFILLSEADFFGPSEQQEVRHVAERYIGKSDPYIVMESTPNAPGGLFDSIEKEPESTCLYKRLKLDWTVGLGKIFTEQEIQEAIRSVSFEREYNLKYLGLQGSSFKPFDIQRAQEIEYSLDITEGISRSMGVDVGYTGGISGGAFSFCITEYTDRKIKVMYSEEFIDASNNDMVQKALELMDEYDVIKVWVDNSGIDFCRMLKLEIGENPLYQQVFERQKHDKIPEKFKYNTMTVCPISFSVDHKAMMSHSKALLSDGIVAIDRRFDKLLIALNTATDRENSLQKDAMSYSDVFDSFRLAINEHMYKMGGDRY